MTDPLNSYQTNYGRFYSHPIFGSLGTDPLDPYSPKPSITNIIGMMSKDFLPRYYAKLVAEHAITNLNALRFQVERFGPQVAIGSLKSVPNQPNANAAIGDEIHAAIDAWCENPGNVPEFSTTTAAAMYAQWQHFIGTYPIRVVRSEYTVWSYKHGYAGTGDLILEVLEPFVSLLGAVVPKGVWLVDTKSGNRVYPEVALQTSAAAMADVILDAGGNESPMIRPDFQGVIHIRPRSVKLYRLYRTDEAWETFLACKRLFDWKRFDADLVMADGPFVSQYRKDAA